jgi:MFS family permease
MLPENRRYFIYAAMFIMMMISYVDRINLSVAVDPIAGEFRLGPVEKGYLLSSYLWVYLLLIVPLGIAADRIGTRRVTSTSMAVWSVGGAMTGAATGYLSLIGSRLVLGAGEASSYPAGGRVIREWAPRSERGLAAAWLNSGAYAGPAIGAIGIGWIVAESGWRESFYVTGGIGLVVAAAWYLLYRRPEDAAWLGRAERERILAERDTEGAPAAAPRPRALTSLASLLRNKSMWGVALSQGCAGYTLYLFMTWLPSYLASSQNLDVLKSSMFTAVPYAAAAVLTLVLGRISDAVLRRGELAYGGRRKIIAVSMLCSAIILATPFVGATWIILVLFSISLTCVSTAMAMNIALTGDLLTDSAHAGAATGILITGGNTFGLLAPIVTGYAVSFTGGFSAAFIIAGALLLAGTMSILTLTRRPIDTTARSPEQPQAVQA